MEIRPVGAELFNADGRTDMSKLIVALRDFAKSAPKKGARGFVYSRKLFSVLSVYKRKIWNIIMCT